MRSCRLRCSLRVMDEEEEEERRESLSLERSGVRVVAIVLANLGAYCTATVSIEPAYFGRGRSGGWEGPLLERSRNKSKSSIKYQ